MKAEYFIILVLLILLVWLLIRQQKMKQDSFQKYFDEFLNRFSKVVDKLNQVELDNSRHGHEIQTIAGDLDEIKKQLKSVNLKMNHFDKKNNEFILAIRTFSDEISNIKIDCKFNKSCKS